MKSRVGVKLAWRTSKVVGPIFVYFNALENPKDASQAELDTLAATQGNPTVPQTWHDNAFALWNDALAKATEVRAAWPFDWVNGVDYPHKSERGNVTGQVVLDDPQAATTKLPNLTIGLAHPDYIGNGGAFAQRSGLRYFSATAFNCCGVTVASRARRPNMYAAPSP